MNPWITASGAFLGALIAVLIAQEGGRRQARAARGEARIDRQREVVADVLRAGLEWTQLQQLLVPAFGRMSRADVDEFVNLDSGRRLVAVITEYRKAPTNANLGIRDPELVELIELVTAAADEFNEYMAPVSDTKTPDDVRFEAVLTALGQVYKIRNSLLELERRSRNFYRVSVSGELHLQGKHWWKRWS